MSKAENQEWTYDAMSASCDMFSAFVATRPPLFDDDDKLDCNTWKPPPNDAVFALANKIDLSFGNLDASSTSKSSSNVYFDDSDDNTILFVVDDLKLLATGLKLIVFSFHFLFVYILYIFIAAT